MYKYHLRQGTRAQAQPADSLRNRQHYLAPRAYRKSVNIPLVFFHPLLPLCSSSFSLSPTKPASTALNARANSGRCNLSRGTFSIRKRNETKHVARSLWSRDTRESLVGRWSFFCCFVLQKFLGELDRDWDLRERDLLRGSHDSWVASSFEVRWAIFGARESRFPSLKNEV